MIFCVLLLLMETSSKFWRRRRRRSSPPRLRCREVRNCGVSSWTIWSACSYQCGTSGTQRRTRVVTWAASCRGSCPYSLRETQACNRDNCQYGGTPHRFGCSCRRGYGGTCCDRGELSPGNNFDDIHFLHTKDSSSWKVIRSSSAGDLSHTSLVDHNKSYCSLKAKHRTGEIVEVYHRN